MRAPCGPSGRRLAAGIDEDTQTLPARGWPRSGLTQLPAGVGFRDHRHPRVSADLSGDRVVSQTREADNMLADLFRANSAPDWQWFERGDLTYDNAKLFHAMIERALDLPA